MISNACKIEDFFRKVDGRRRLEAIHLANLEITEAERRLLSQKDAVATSNSLDPDYSDYSESLKQFIHYVRYSVRPKLSDSNKSNLFNSYLNSIPANQQANQE
jgi:hypothetical protein